MPPYRYDSAPNRFAPSIAEILSRYGDLAARHADQVGAVQARAAEQQGQIWGNGIASIGQMLTDIPRQQRAQRESAQQQELRDLQIQSARELQAGRAAVGSMMRGDQLPPGETGPRQQSFLDGNGLFDVGKLTQALGAAGFGHLAPDLVKGAETINDSILKHQELEQKTAQAHALLIGDLADGALKLEQTGMPLLDALDLVVQPPLATQRFKPEEYASIRQHLERLPPEQQHAALDALRDQAARIAPGKTLAEGAQEVDRYGRVIASGGSKPPTEAELAAELSSPDPVIRARAERAMAALKPPPNRTAEQDDQRYRQIIAFPDKATPEDKAWAKAYEQQKTIATDRSASAATDRQARSIEQQTAQQKRAQDFTQLQAARADIQKNVDTPYLTARTSADTLRDVVAAAKNGNKVAGSLQSLETTMAAIRAQGLNRINTAEIGTTGNAGSLWDAISGYVGKKLEGQPVPEDIQRDMLAFADILEKAAYKKYTDAHDSANSLYGTKIPRSFAAPVSEPSTAAPKEGTEGVVNGVPAVWKTVDGKAGWYRR